VTCTRCGHPRDAHTHYRDGTDCGTCGRLACPSYRRPGRRRDTAWQLAGIVAAVLLGTAAVGWVPVVTAVLPFTVTPTLEV
jgi:hypothetical protein